MFGKLNSLKDKTKEISEKAGELTAKVGEKIDEGLNELNEALPTIQALGLSMKDFDIEMGLMPEIRAKLIGSIEAIEEEKVDELAGQHQDSELLKTILKALKAASQIKKKLPGIPFSGVEMGVKMGIPPNVSVKLVD